MIKKTLSSKKAWGRFLEQALPHVLVTTVALTIVLSWALEPNRAAALMSAASGSPSGSASPSGSPSGSPTPTPTPVPPVDCTKAPDAYSLYCLEQVENSPTVAIPATQTQNFYLKGMASVELNVSRSVGNRPPVAAPFSLSTTINQPTQAITLSATDPDEPTRVDFDFEVRFYPRNGSISRTGASLTYTPNPGFVGQDAFIYTADDGRRQGGAVVTVVVRDPNPLSTPPNSPPVFKSSLDQTLAFNRPSPTLSASVTDVQSVDLSFQVPNLLGSLSGGPASFNYNPSLFYGHDQFFVVAEETSGNLQRTILPVNVTVADPPDATTTLYDGDPDQGASQVGQPAVGYGALKITKIDTTVFPNGKRTFTAKTVDGAGRLAKAAVDFTVDNEPPGIVWDQKPNQTYIRSSLTLGVVATDTIHVQDVVFQVDNISARTQFLTTPSISPSTYLIPNYDVQGLADGPHTFTFYAIDNAFNVSPTLSATYKVDNNAPSVSLFWGIPNGTPSLIGQFGSPVTLSGIVALRFDATDTGSGVALLEGTFGAESVPRLSSTTSSISYLLNTAAIPNGAYSISVHSVDAVGNETRILYSYLYIQNNVAPVATSQLVTMTENTGQLITLHATDANDPTGASLTYTIDSLPVNGTLSPLSGTPPQVTYTPSPGYNGTDTFTFRVSDGQLTSLGRENISISGINDRPTADSFSVNVAKNSFVLITPSGSDPEKVQPTFQSVTAPTNGILEPQQVGWKYTPSADYIGPDSFTYKANDGSLDSAAPYATVTINVQGSPSNHVPVADPKNVTVPMGVSTDVLLSGSDADGQSLTYRVTDNPTKGTFSGILPDLIYKPNDQFKGTDTFSYVVNDSIVDSAKAIVTVNVVDNTPPTISVISPADGTTVSDFVTVSAQASDNDSIQSVQVLVDNKWVSSLTSPYIYNLDVRTSYTVGSHTLTLLATDASGNTSQVTRSFVVNAAAPLAAPTITITNPLNNQLMSGVVTVLAQTTNDVTSVNLTIGANGVLTMSPTSQTQGHYSVDWDTSKYPDGPYVLVAKATGGGGTAEASANVIVDNTAPTAAWVLPTVSRATQGLFGVQAFDVNAQDANGIAHVQFWFSNKVSDVPTGNGNEFTFLFDTRAYPDGQNYGMQAIVFDKAGNQFTSPIRTFNINNTNPPPSDIRIMEHPLDGSFVTSDIDAQISATFSGGIQLPISNTSLQVYAKQNGVQQPLTGTVSYANGSLRFNGVIPPNAEIKWIVNVVDSNSLPLSAQYVFTRMMSKDTGGDVYADTPAQGRFQITIPPGALKDDMLVAIDPLDASSLTAGLQQNDPAIASQGQRELAGPFKTYGRNATNAEIHDLARPATILYYDLQPPQQADEQNRAVQIQSLDGNVWRPVGTSAAVKSSGVKGQVATRSVSVPTSTLATFRVNSVPVAASGIEGVFAYPNPFNPNQEPVSFQYTLKENSDVDIVVYDLFGNLVRVMHWPAGSPGGGVSSTPPWDGRNGRGEVVANGGYIVQIVAHDSQGHLSRAIYKVGVVK